jgi:uncharacterized RDD family membrane protein YckC
MSIEYNGAEPVLYASFSLRFSALVVDLMICIGIFLFGGIFAGILLENNIRMRIAAYAALLVILIGYEPYMVARYGGTFGHRKRNIRIVCGRSHQNLPLWRSAVRSIVKQIFGIVSFVFMFATSRAQGLHDLAADARVIIRDHEIAAEDDRFQPPAAWIRRVIVTVVYVLTLLVAMSVAASLMVSPACRNEGLCYGSESSRFLMLSGGWLLLTGVSIVLGLMGRLPGCSDSRIPN